MAKKFLDLEGLKTLWGKITGKITASEEKVMGEVSKKANSTDVYTKGEVNTELGKKQNTLVSGTNIRTINGQSLLDVAKGDLKVVTDLSNYYNKGQTDTAINNAKKAVKDELLGGAGEAFDTLKELSTALGDDPNFATTITNKLGTKADKVVNGTYGTKSILNEPASQEFGLKYVDKTNSKIIKTFDLNGQTGKIVLQHEGATGALSNISINPDEIKLFCRNGMVTKDFTITSNSVKIDDKPLLMPSDLDSKLGNYYKKAEVDNKIKNQTNPTINSPILQGDAVLEGRLEFPDLGNKEIREIFNELQTTAISAEELNTILV